MAIEKKVGGIVMKPGRVNESVSLIGAVKGADTFTVGITAETPLIVHCRTGHQASQAYFLLKHLLGLKNVRWFDASWSAWAARKDLPAEQ